MNVIDLKKAVAGSTSFSEVARKMGIGYRSGGAISCLKRRIEKFGMNTSHFLGMAHRKGLPGKKKRWEEILTNNPERMNRESARLLRRALKEMGRDENCSICGLKPEWNGKWLVLDIDHEDGNWKNNSPENLRFLCPNCHSQQSTSGRRTTPIGPAQCDRSETCPCINCTNRRSSSLSPHPDVGRWPNNLAELVLKIPITHIASSVGVSETAVRKRLKKLKILSNGPGYWSSQERKSRTL